MMLSAKMNLIFIAVFSGVACLVNGQSCRTPSGDNGDCISIRNCQPLLTLVTKSDRTTQDVDLLRKSKCDYKDNVHYVCCPKQPSATLPPSCYTVEGAAGKCISLYSCPHIAIRLKPPVSDDNKTYVWKSRYPKDRPSRNVNAIILLDVMGRINIVYAACPATDNDVDITDGNCANRMTAFPPDSRTECCGIDAAAGSKIIRVKDIAIDRYPWLVVIEYEQLGVIKLMCGGVLISGRYVMTAGHCVDGQVLNLGTPKRVRLGEYDISHEGRDCQPVEADGVDCTDGVTRIEIEKIIPHPQYEPDSAENRNDIALIRLKEFPPYTDFIRPICLPTKDLTLPENTPANFSLYASGWGIVSTKQALSNDKLDVELPFVTSETCQSVYDHPITLWKGQLCAGGKPGKDSCRGDSGGPLMYENGRTYELIGIESFGPTPCGTQGKPGIYSNVYKYLDWIKATIVA